MKETEAPSLAPQNEPVAAAAPVTATRIVELSIALRDITPTIWRRLHVPADLRLDELALVLLETMGWNNSHLHAFEVGDARYVMADDEFADGELDECEFTLADLIRGGAQGFTFRYDFGDDWAHEVKIEPVVLAPLPGVEYPTCIAGQRACPPEDAGGAPGYEDLLAALANPKHDRHQELSEWLGKPYDPEAFTTPELNLRLARWARKRGRRVRAR